MRLVLDTNVVVSGLLWNGTPARLLDLAQTGHVELFTSRWMLSELERTLKRRKFANAIATSELAAADFVLGYSALTTLTSPESVPSVISQDPDDDHVLACAVAAHADLLVSGDRHLLDLHDFQDIVMVSPAEALSRIDGWDLSE